jgi:hypothetical protein
MSYRFISGQATPRGVAVLLLLCGIVPRAEGASAILAPVGSFASGYRTDDVFKDSINPKIPSSFDVFGGQAAIYGPSGLQILNRSTGAMIDSAGTPTAYFSAIPPEVDIYNGFTTFDPDGQSLWVGFTTYGNINDQIFHVTKAGSTWTWNAMAQLSGNYDLAFVGSRAYVAANPGWLGNSIYSLDTSMPGGVPATSHQVIATTGGYSAGLATDATGNLYYATSVFTPAWVSTGALYEFEASKISTVLAGGSPLTLADAIKLSDLPSGATDTQVDAAGHVLVTTSVWGGSNRVLMWDGVHTGDGQNYSEVADGTGSNGNFFTFVKTAGDFTNGGTLYVSDGLGASYSGIAAINAVPEPSTLVLIVTGIAALAWRCRRKQ